MAGMLAGLAACMGNNGMACVPSPMCVKHGSYNGMLTIPTVHNRERRVENVCESIKLDFYTCVMAA